MGESQVYIREESSFTKLYSEIIYLNHILFLIKKSFVNVAKHQRYE